MLGKNEDKTHYRKSWRRKNKNDIYEEMSDMWNFKSADETQITGIYGK